MGKASCFEREDILKKFDLKIRLQWNWYRSALIGAAIALLLAPTAGSVLGTTNEESKEKKETTSIFNGISFGPKLKVMLNGKVVAVTRNEDAAEEAFKAARLAYNAEGVKILDVEVAFEEVDKEKDSQEVLDMKVSKGEELVALLQEEFASMSEGKQLAYTLRSDEYTVTFNSMEELVATLEKVQGQYDTEDDFQVVLQTPEAHNVTMYEVGIEKKTTSKKKDSSTETVATEVGTTEGATEDDQQGNTDDALAEQSADDGVKHIGFADSIQIMETYVGTDQIKAKEVAYNEMTTQEKEDGIYVIQSGDLTATIAEKHNMTVEELKERNPHIEGEGDLFYGDRLNVKIPARAVEVLVEKQETYKEDYYADVVYEDDSSMYIGENTVVQEGVSGVHTVTDLVTYKGGAEYRREQVEETIQVAAVAQIVRRGTKSKPTYMYPMSIWPITSNFGYRWGRLHAGVDVGVPTGTTVRASRGGKVTVAGWLGGYGNCVMIDHGDGVVTVYGHLSEVTCSVGQYVDQGQQVALSGNTGRSTGPHLHFEIRVNGTPVDPMPYLYGNAS